MKISSWGALILLGILSAFAHADSTGIPDLVRFAICEVGGHEFDLYTQGVTPIQNIKEVQAVESGVDADPVFLDGNLQVSSDGKSFQVGFSYYWNIQTLDSSSCILDSNQISAFGQQVIKMLIHGFWISEGTPPPSSSLCQMFKDGSAIPIDFHVYCYTDSTSAGASSAPACEKITIIENEIPVGPTPAPSSCSSRIFLGQGL